MVLPEAVQVVHEVYDGMGKLDDEQLLAYKINLAVSDRTGDSPDKESQWRTDLWPPAWERNLV